MCDACEGRGPVDRFDDCEVFIGEFKAKGYFEIDGESAHYELDINFCPMCGKKLTEEVNCKCCQTKIFKTEAEKYNGLCKWCKEAE